MTGSPLTRRQQNPRQSLRADHAAPRGRDPFYYKPVPPHLIWHHRLPQARRERPCPDLPQLLRHAADHDHPVPLTATFREQVDAAERPIPLELSGAATGDPTPLDHQSILKTVQQRWDLPSPTARDAVAPGFGDVLTLATLRTDDPIAGVTVPASGGQGPAAGQPSHLREIQAELISRQFPRAPSTGFHRRSACRDRRLRKLHPGPQHRTVPAHRCDLDNLVDRHVCHVSSVSAGMAGRHMTRDAESPTHPVATPRKRCVRITAALAPRGG